MGITIGWMEREPFESKSVRAAGYDPTTRVLEIEFHTGRTYRYRDVPEGVFQWLRRTPNKGAYVSRMISGRYPHQEITGEAITDDTAADADGGPSLLEALQASLDKLDGDQSR